MTDEIKYYLPVEGNKGEWVELPEGYVAVELTMNCKTGELVLVRMRCKRIRLAHVFSSLNMLLLNIGTRTLDEIRNMSGHTTELHIDWKVSF